MSAEFDTMTAMELRQHIINREISPVALTRRALDKAEATQKTLNCFSVLAPEAALATAKSAEQAVMKGDALGLLHGLPFSAKDLISVAGLPYMSGSRTMQANIGTVDAPWTCHGLIPRP